MLVVHCPQPITGPYETIKLTKGMSTIVSADDFTFLNQFYWRAVKSSSNFYALRRYCLNGKMYTVRMHREINRCVHWMKVHHINHNTLDNRRENLQSVTKREHRHLDGWHYFPDS